MKAKRLFSLLTLSATLGIAFGISSNREVKKADALIETKLCVLNDEYDMSYNLETSEYYIENINLSNSQQFYISSGLDIYGFSSLDSNSYDYCYEGELIPGTLDLGYIGVSEYSSYNIYFYADGDNSIIRVTSPTLEAEKWAREFEDNVGCTEPFNEKPTGWDWYSENFAYLSEEAKSIFVDAVASNDQTATVIQRAAFIHDMCVAKYDECSVFMYNEHGSRSILINNTNANYEFNISALVITIISVTSTLTLLGLVFFKKNKARR